MIALALFSCLAAGLVWWAGRKDAALDPRLTTVVLALLALFPVLVESMPKIAVLPADGNDLGGIPWRTIAGAVWLAGFVVSLVRLLALSAVLRGWRKDSELLETIEGVELRRSERTPGPVAAGVFRKVIFVPPAWDEWDGSRRRLVLAHEMAHHRRKDPLRRWIAGLAVAVNWFNPLVRWVVRRLLLQCEFACDQEVLRRGERKTEYASLLCDLAAESRSRGLGLAMADRPGLERRVRRMMDGRDHPDDRLTTGWLVLFAVAAAGLIAMLGAERIAGYTREEIEMRRSADPFPGNAP